MENEGFIIDVEGSQLIVSPQDDETYIISDGNRILGVIEPVWIDDDISWVSTDLISQDYVKLIGEAIQSHDM